MSELKEYYSPDEVAELLGLHVRTIRRFISEDKIKATRVGKQYRIAENELRQLIGSALPPKFVETQKRHRRIITSTTVDIEPISQAEQERLINLLLGAFHSLNAAQNSRRFDSIYEEGKGRLRLLINADLDMTNAIFGMIRGILEDTKLEE